MSFQRVLFFSMVVACPAPSYFTQIYSDAATSKNVANELHKIKISKSSNPMTSTTVTSQKQEASAHVQNTEIQNMSGMKGFQDKNFNQVIDEFKPNKANCIGWFRRRGSSSTTSSSVGAAEAETEGSEDAGGNTDDSNLQTSRRLRARRITTTTRRSRHN